MCCCPESNSLCVTFVIGKVSKGMVSRGAQRCGVANPEKKCLRPGVKNCHSGRCVKNVVRQTPVWRQLVISQTMHCHGNSAMWSPCYLPWILPVPVSRASRRSRAARRSRTPCHALHAFHTLHTCTLNACQWSVPSYHACHAPIYGHPKPIVAECHWPVEEKHCGSRHMYGPTGPMSRAAHRSHTVRMSRNAHRSRTHCVALHACHALHTFCVLNARENGYALMSHMSRTHNAWQAMNPGNARMSRTARMSHTTRIPHSY